ncbi:nicotinate phosphoribosyltransferase, partial [Quaeritorhiza haematococci]
LANLRLTPQEHTYLSKNCPYFTHEYLEYLRNFRYNPDYVHIDIKPDPLPSTTTTDSGDSAQRTGSLSLTIHGPWHATILFEVPLLALISETYFSHVDTDWLSLSTSPSPTSSPDPARQDQFQRAYVKGRRLIEGGARFVEFGTRRRRAVWVHEEVVGGLCEAQRGSDDEEEKMQGKDGVGEKGRFLGTSNVWLAMKFGLKPSGTVAHEWTMAVS